MPGTTLIVTAALAMLAFSPGGDRDPSRSQAGTTAAPQQDGRGERARRVGSGRRPAPRRPARTARTVGPVFAVFIPGNARHSVEATGKSGLRVAYVFAADSFHDVEYVFDE